VKSAASWFVLARDCSKLTLAQPDKTANSISVSKSQLQRGW
jgi:hypothetical protein